MAPVFGPSEEAPNYLPDAGMMFEPIKIDQYKPEEKPKEIKKPQPVFGQPAEAPVKPRPMPTP